MLKTSKLTTIDRHIAEQQDLHPEATGEFSFLLHDLTFAVRLIDREIRRAGLNDILGLTKNINVHGEHVRKLDEYAFNVIYKYMSQGGHICVMASEEAVDIMPIHSEYKNGKYVFVFDPLDGSTNIDVSIAIGTIFSIYMRLDPTSTNRGKLSDILQPGYKQVAAGYIIYGSSTLFVYTTGNGVNVFTYDPTIGEFILTSENLKIPKRGNHYSCNESYYYKWDEKIRKYLDYLKTPTKDDSHPYIMRYVATAAADIHRVLHFGGIYLYPANTDKPNGKLRLVYEANPLAMIVEQAGGSATDGFRRILDIIPGSIHERVPFFAGSIEDVLEAESFLSK